MSLYYLYHEEQLALKKELCLPKKYDTLHRRTVLEAYTAKAQDLMPSVICQFDFFVLLHLKKAECD